MDIIITIGAKRYNLLIYSLQKRVDKNNDSGQPIVVDDAYVSQWAKNKIKADIDDLIALVASWETAPGAPLDISNLTPEQRLQVQALIASFTV